MKKIVLTILATLILILCACSTTPSVTLDIRGTAIHQGENNFLTPDNWGPPVPQECLQSSVRIEPIYENSINAPASSTLVDTQEMHGQNGEVIWIITFLTADHVAKDESGTRTPSSARLFPVQNYNAERTLPVISYLQINNDNGHPIDAGFVSMYTTTNFPDFVNIGVSALIPGIDLTDANSLYYAFGYPSNSVFQYTVSQIDSSQDAINITNGTIMKPTGNNTIYSGNSGGPNCNQNGQVVGIVTHAYGELGFIVTMNPNSIQTQANTAISQAMAKFQALGYH